ncbi:MAG: VWA domain-containing protein [Alistipes sp.]|jgi:Ca-activated chloride channel family protein|nr:VWA domain-containing protein [Alistipes sp.]
MEFASPKILWFLLLLIPLVAYYIYRTRQGGASVTVSTTESLGKAPKSWRYYLRHIPFVLRCAALSLIVVAIARPQSAEHYTTTTTEGIDIVLAVDISTSMLAMDFTPDRLSVAKGVAGEFIGNRTGDRIGIVAFAGESFTQSPLTTDTGSLQTMLSRLNCGIIEDGTAIGNGLATALNRLRESDCESKVVILLTDGVNNRGEISPITAAQIAKELGIKVYTIGVGRKGNAPYPLFDERGRKVDEVTMKVEIDEDILRRIAELTGGEYFRATDEQTLKAVYSQIDTLEKSRVEVEEHTTLHEEFLVFVLWALAALLAEFFINRIVLKRLP